MQMTVLDVSREPPRRVTGQLVREYPLGVTVDDARGVRYYVTHDKIISRATNPKPTDAIGQIW